MIEKFLPVLVLASTLASSACVDPKSADTTDTAYLDTGESPDPPDPLGSLEGVISYVRESCGWVSQQWHGEDPTLNCGPASLLISAACVKGTDPSEEDLKNSLDYMDANAWATGYGGSGGEEEGYPGSYTSGSDLVATMEGYYRADAMLVGDNYGEWGFGENYGNAVALSDLLDDVRNGYPPIIATVSQGLRPTGDEMVADGTPHYMVLMGAFLDEDGIWYVVLHDPNPYPKDREYGELHAYTLDSFIWPEHAAIRSSPTL